MDYVKTKKWLSIRKYAYETFLLVIGCFIMACGTSFFLLPNQLSSGGFAGLATIAYYLLKIPLGTTIFALNIPLFILGYIRIDLLDQFPAITQDRFLACVYGGIAIRNRKWTCFKI